MKWFGSANVSKFEAFLMREGQSTCICRVLRGILKRRQDREIRLVHRPEATLFKLGFSDGLPLDGLVVRFPESSAASPQDGPLTAPGAHSRGRATGASDAPTKACRCAGELPTLAPWNWALGAAKVKPDSSWFRVIANLPKSPKPLQACTIRGSHPEDGPKMGT